MQSDIVDFQRQGWEPQEIMAGLANVLPKNIWLYVAQIPNLARLGKNFVPRAVPSTTWQRSSRRSTSSKAAITPAGISPTSGCTSTRASRG